MAKKLKVLRIERNGVGPYRSGDRHKWQNTNHATDKRPAPSWDDLDEFKEKFGFNTNIKFGFKNWSQAKKWFYNKKELRNLKALGFRWKWVKAKHIMEIDKQVMFC